MNEEQWEPGYDCGPDVECSGECEECGEWCEELSENGACPECDEMDAHDRYDEDGPAFADPGGISALRASSASNPRNLPCPTCGAPDVLTPQDRACGYQCNACADRAEGRGGY